jgi:drug/metabolite transporter (DMT)-like permease
MNALLAWYFVAVWGAGYVFTKLGLQYAAPFTFLAVRFLFGLACLLPIVILWRPKWPASRHELAHLVVAGLLMHAVQLGGSHYAQYLGMSAGVSALIISSQPLVTACIAARFLGERLRYRQWFGVVVGLGGVTLVVWHQMDIRAVTTGSLIGTLLGLAGVTAATLYQRHFSPSVDLKAAAFVQFAAAALALLPLSIIFEGFEIQYSGQLLIAILFLVIFTSILGVSVLNYLMRHGEAFRVVSMMYLPPVFAVALELAMFGLLPGPIAIAGMALACAGVAMTVWTSRSPSPVA